EEEARFGQRRLERRERLVVVHLGAAPVIEAGAAQVPVVDAKAERLDEVQRTPGGHCQAADAAGVARDLGLDEHDAKRRIDGRSDSGVRFQDRAPWFPPSVRNSAGFTRVEVCYHTATLGSALWRPNGTREPQSHAISRSWRASGVRRCASGTA